MKRILIIGLIILTILAVIILIIYLLSREKEVPIEVIEQDPNISRLGQCNLDIDCQRGGLNSCRMLTYSILNSDGTTQYIKKGDSYCVDWCETNEDCVEEGYVCRNFDYIEGEEVRTWQGCIDPNNYTSVLDMASVDTWVE